MCGHAKYTYGPGEMKRRKTPRDTFRTDARGTCGEIIRVLRDVYRGCLETYVISKPMKLFLANVTLLQSNFLG